MSSYALTKLQRSAGDPKEGGAHTKLNIRVIAGLDVQTGDITDGCSGT
jgi:hypothetical protein